MIIWFFGYPGVGKDYVAEKFSRLFSIRYIDGDTLLTEDERNKLIAGTFTAHDRLQKLKRIADHLNTIQGDIVITDSLPDKESRRFLRDTFGNRILFVRVTASQKTHEERMQKREQHFFTANILNDYIKKHWSDPDDFPHRILENETMSEKDLEMEFARIYKYVHP